MSLFLEHEPVNPFSDLKSRADRMDEPEKSYWFAPCNLCKYTFVLLTIIIVSLIVVQILNGWTPYAPAYAT